MTYPCICRRCALLATTLLVSACATPPRSIPPATEIAAVLESPAYDVMTIPEPLPLPGQLKQIDTETAAPEPADPTRRIDDANAAARVEPVRDGFINAIQRYPYVDGALYQIYAAPGQVTDIALQAGERLVGSGPIAAGDTTRWIIGDTVSGAGADERTHILVKPTRADLKTNLVINTDRRTYHVELRAVPSAYMASVAWTYPQDDLIALRQSRQSASASVAQGLDLSSLDFRYRIEGDRPDWRPLRAFDDGRQVFIEFPTSIARSEMPPLFVIGPADGAELVNYRVTGRYMVVNRLFARAELRLGDRRSAQAVHIVREEAPASRGVRR